MVVEVIFETFPSKGLTERAMATLSRVQRAKRSSFSLENVFGYFLALASLHLGVKLSVP